MTVLAAFVTLAVLPLPLKAASELVRAAWDEHYDELAMEIRGDYPRRWFAGTEQIYNQEMLPGAADRDPTDLVLRRTRMLLDHLSVMPGFANGARFQAELEGLADRNTTASDRKALFLEICALRRRIAFSNPLLDFKDILYCRWGGEKPQINYGPYAGKNSRPGGGVYILRDAFGESPSEENLLTNSVVGNGRLEGTRLTPGTFRDVELSYDGQTVYFSYGERAKMGDTPPPLHKEEHIDFYHVYKAEVDGSGLTMLTDDPHWDEHSPVELPNGRVVFLSGARNAGQRCWTWIPASTSNLYSMNPDGSDKYCINWHETNQWEPSVDNNGMLVYTQWDYIDKDSRASQCIWICKPDGTDPRAPSGNYPYSNLWNQGGVAYTEHGWWIPKAMMTIRAIPGSHKYSAVSCEHHNGIYGPIIHIDINVPEEDPNRPQVRQITLGEYNMTPWPLSENFFLASSKPIHRPAGREYTEKLEEAWDYGYALHLIDAFGNKEILYEGEGLAPRDPIPLKPREKPPVIATTTFQGERRGALGHRRATLSVTDVYNADVPLPEGVKITEMRIVQIVPYTVAKNAYSTGYAHAGLARQVIGTVPVEDDGSVYCEAPVEREIYFQTLDEKGMVVQNMRSGTYVHPGEHLSCVGCHEDKWETPPPVEGTPIAMRRAPSKITPPGYNGAAPFHFSRLVQPVLDAKCQPCHEKEGACDLSGTTCTDTFCAKNFGKFFWSNAYWNLRDYAFWWLNFLSHDLNTTNPCNPNKDGKPNLHNSRSIPGQFGARASRLYTEGYLDERHYGVKLTDDEFRRVVMWLDLNSNFHGSWDHLQEQAAGEVIWADNEDIDPDNPLGVENDVPVRDNAPTMAGQAHFSPVPVSRPRIRRAWVVREGRRAGLRLDFGVLADGRSGARSRISVEVYDVAGRHLARGDHSGTVDGRVTVPLYAADGTSAAGIHLCRIRTATHTLILPVSGITSN